MRFVLVVADSLRADVYGFAGGPAQTPTLDSLVNRGAIAERVYSSSPWTLPSLAAMFTGCWGHRVGLVNWLQPWPQTPQNLFRVFARSGWSVGSYVFNTRYLFTGLPESGVSGTSLNRDRLFKQLEQSLANSGNSFTFIHYWGTHVPYVSGDMDIGTWKRLADGVLGVLGAGPEMRDKVRSMYTLAVESFSEQWLPGLLRVLESGPGMEETLLIITSDHGETWGERLGPGERVRGVFDLHGNHLFEEGLRVPLVVVGCGVGKGVRVGGMARTVDLAPTLLEWAGLSPLEGADGESLAAVLKEGGVAKGAVAVAAMNRSGPELAMEGKSTPDVARVWHRFAAIRGKSKWLLPSDGGSGLSFDLSADPGEVDGRELTGPDLAEARAWLANELGRGRCLELPATLFREAEELAARAAAEVLRSRP